MTDDELPPKPIMRWLGYDPKIGNLHGYTHNEMHDYGKACADAAIDRCIAFLNAEQENTQMHNYAAVYANKLRSLKGRT